jgi:hypothetical protein
MNTNHSPSKEKFKRNPPFGFDANNFLILYFTKEKEVFMILTDMTWTPSVTF